VKKLLVGFALLLTGLLVLQWQSWSPAPPGPPSDAETTDSISIESAPSQTDAVPEPPPAKEEYASVIERPLFLPDRRPPPDEPELAEEPEPEALTELDGMDLNAVVITSSTVSAWVRRPNTRDAVRLRLGDEFEGWTVHTIEPDRLVFERQGETDELILRDYANAPPPPLRTSPPAAERRPRTPPGREPPPATAEDLPTQTTTRGAGRRPR
jgi:hypothetical protein